MARRGPRHHSHACARPLSRGLLQPDASRFQRKQSSLPWAVFAWRPSPLWPLPVPRSCCPPPG
eukprot:15206653-Alexandrium_andersonii.AAC.1